MRPGVTGVVLAGGASRRFASDKAFAPWAGGTLAEHAALLLSRLFGETLVVVKDAAAFRRLERPGLRVVEDGLRGTHPLGGLRAALRAARTGWVYLRACDMPFLRPELVDLTLAARGDRPAVVPVWGGRRQPLCAAYSRGCLPAVEAALAAGRYSLRGVLDAIDAREIPREAVTEADPDGRSFIDVDTRGDYARARSLAAC